MTATRLSAPGGASPAERSDTRATTAITEVALLLVHLSVVLGFSRVYEDGSFAGPLVGFAVGAMVLAVACRRWWVPVPVVALVAVGGAALAATWLVFPATARFGLPTTETWDLAGEAVRVGRARFQEVAPPAPVLPGFQLAAGLALWGTVWFADWAAFRLRATVEAVAPSAVVFVFCAVLGSGDHRVGSTLAFTAAVLCFVACHRALRAQLDQAWLTTSPVAGPRAVLRAGAALAVVGLLGGAVIAPHLPGAGREAVLRWRTDTSRTGDRTTISPIVDVRKRLVEQAATELFQVTASRPAYWRLTALDRFDGRLWTSSSTYSPADDDLEGATPDLVDERRNEQQIEIQDLSVIWAPAAYRARSVEQATEALSWDPESGSLIVEVPEASGDDVTSDGLEYLVVSEAPILDADVLRAAGGADPDGIEAAYLGLSGGFPDLAVDLARAAVAGAETGSRYDRAIALQNWFRTTFEYSLDVPAGHSDDAIVDFLQSRAGYCEQFAGTFAAMARSLGIPSRVAVGFTPGDPLPDDPDRYQVRGRHAHAWPEVYFAGIGWVPFEPTPGRGIPDTRAYTGLSAQQEAPTVTSVPTSSTTIAGDPGTTTVPSTSPPGTTVPPAAVAAGPPDDPSEPTGGAAARHALVVAAVLAMAWLTALLLAPAVLRRRRPPGRSGAAVLHAWHHGLAPVHWLTGLRPRAAETHHEFSRRVAAPLGDLAGPFRELADLATTAAWGHTGTTPADADRADALADELQAEARRRQSTPARLRRRLSWREAFGRPRLTP